MEEHFKNHIIVVNATGPDLKFKWRTSCVIVAEKSRTPIKSIKWDLDYDSRKEAERIGLFIAKKWIGERKAEALRQA
jgi:hypothetical protein